MATASSLVDRDFVRDMVGAWPHQVRMVEGFLDHMEAGHQAIAAVSATGTGKSRVMFEMLQEDGRRGRRAILYTNRRLLFDQISQGMDQCGITHGKRASGHRANLMRPIQLAMVQTERGKVLDSDSRERHKADMVYVDEAHMNSNGAILELMKRHRDDGATVIGFTATPIGIGHFFKHMVEGAKTSEGRECGALLPAMCFGPDIPDRKFIGRVKVGEEELNAKKRLIYAHSIFGRVVDHWYQYNPRRLSTMLFAPDVPSSLWFAMQLYSVGINAAHIDAKGVWYDGQWHPGDVMRQRVLDELRSNRIEILTNRFVLREGLDCPSVYHLILATKFGSETTYVQAVGRVLRNHHSLPGHVVIQDHGGNFLLWGSPNEDREWSLHETGEERAYIRKEQMRRDERTEPFSCPKCFAMRSSGSRCWNCGYVATQRTRMVMQPGGELKEQRGKFWRPRRTAADRHLQLWKSCYWGARESGQRTFAQAIAWFGQKMYMQTGCYMLPKRDWPYMPTKLTDEVRRVCDVPFHRLVPDPERGEK